MERRTEPRIRRRMECEVRFAGWRHRGVVVDASPQGLFVRTGARPTSAAELEIRMRLPGRSDSLNLRAAPVRMQLAPAPGTGAPRCSMGLRVVEAPESYAAFFRSDATPERSSDRRGPVLRAPLRERRGASHPSADGTRFQSRPAPAPTLVLDEEIQAGASAAGPSGNEVSPLPLIQVPRRPRCGICHRDDRPVLGGVCVWCHGHERG
jgi:PilZ domain